MFVNPGGPGGSGVGLVRAGFGEYLSANLGGAFDIVGFDPRGIGGSDPLHCFASEEEFRPARTSPNSDTALDRVPVHILAPGEMTGRRLISAIQKAGIAPLASENSDPIE